MRAAIEMGLFRGVVVRDGIEPPTPAFRRAAGNITALSRKNGSAAIEIERGFFKGVVARDGIEPPTPAFSGPRSTTELPGLSADL